MFRRFVAVATAVLASLALAEQRTMTRAIEAASLHEGPLDMVAYFVPRPDDLYEVTATFAPRHVDGAPFAPMRIVMGLNDGNGTAFAMPGYPEAFYRFARSGDEVTVSVSTGILSAAAD